MAKKIKKLKKSELLGVQDKIKSVYRKQLAPEAAALIREAYHNTVAAIETLEKDTDTADLELDGDVGSIIMSVPTTSAYTLDQMAIFLDD